MLLGKLLLKKCCPGLPLPIKAGLSTFHQRTVTATRTHTTHTPHTPHTLHTPHKGLIMVKCHLFLQHIISCNHTTPHHTHHTTTHYINHITLQHTILHYTTTPHHNTLQPSKSHHNICATHPVPQPCMIAITYLLYTC